MYTCIRDIPVPIILPVLALTFSPAPVPVKLEGKKIIYYKCKKKKYEKIKKFKFKIINNKKLK